MMHRDTAHIKVLIADKDENSRSAIKLLLGNEYDNIIIIEADTHALTHSADFSGANLAIIDWENDNQHTQSFIRFLRESQPQIIILVLGKHPEDKNSALATGAQAFIYRGDSPDALHNALMGYLNGVTSRRLAHSAEQKSRTRKIYCYQLV